MWPGRSRHSPAPNCARPAPATQQATRKLSLIAQVVIKDPDLCPRYTASVIRGVKIGPSPQWLADALARIGERPINNVVDVTNYVMFELGQPLHAFDYDRVVDQTVIVRRARGGELLTTLDGVERKLTSDTLVISDPERAIGLAGVMGGANTEIDESTVNVFSGVGHVRRFQQPSNVSVIRVAEPGDAAIRKRPAGRVIGGRPAPYDPS